MMLSVQYNKIVLECKTKLVIYISYSYCMMERNIKEGLDQITYLLLRCSFFTGLIMSKSKLFHICMRGSKFQKLNFQLEHKITKPMLHNWIFFVTKDRKKIYRVNKASKLPLSLVVFINICCLKSKMKKHFQR